MTWTPEILAVAALVFGVDLRGGSTPSRGFEIEAGRVIYPADGRRCIVVDPRLGAPASAFVREGAKSLPMGGVPEAVTGLGPGRAMVTFVDSWNPPVTYLVPVFRIRRCQFVVGPVLLTGRELTVTVDGDRISVQGRLGDDILEDRQTFVVMGIAVVPATTYLWTVLPWAPLDSPDDRSESSVTDAADGACLFYSPDLSTDPLLAVYPGSMLMKVRGISGVREVLPSSTSAAGAYYVVGSSALLVTPLERDDVSLVVSVRYLAGRATSAIQLEGTCPDLFRLGP